MRSRENRITDFEKFQNFVEVVFKKQQKAGPDYLSLEDYYGFSICPKGRAGGINPRLIEVFYGNRQYDQEITMAPDFKVNTHFLSESGAELSLLRDDWAYVCIQLFPAKTKYGRQKEDSIILHSHMDPNRLLRPRFQKKLLQQLNSYMAVTCLEGKPSFCDRARVFFIRLNKHVVIDEEIQTIVILKWLGDVLKFVLTVGLSGFLLTIIAKYV